MFSRFRTLLLRWLRVPHDPDPPAGAPGSLRVFRAGRNLYKLRLAGWALAQIGALIGIGFSLTALGWMRDALEAERAAGAPAQVTSAPAAPEPSPEARKGKTARREGPREVIAQFASHAPMWVLPLLLLLEFGGILIYLAQIPITFAIVRLDFELRWYMVTDRSLRIRSGVTSIQEMTMSFANIQQVVVSQGPLQRLLGLADVRVQSAGGGGGGGAHQSGHHHDSMHLGVFHGVENATEIRDLILTRLRQFREAGLGDPDDQRRAEAPAAAPSSTASEPILAARELLEETRALRRALT